MPLAPSARRLRVLWCFLGRARWIEADGAGNSARGTFTLAGVAKPIALALPPGLVCGRRVVCRHGEPARPSEKAARAERDALRRGSAVRCHRASNCRAYRRTTACTAVAGAQPLTESQGQCHWPCDSVSLRNTRRHARVRAHELRAWTKPDVSQRASAWSVKADGIGPVTPCQNVGVVGQRATH